MKETLHGCCCKRQDCPICGRPEEPEPDKEAIYEGFFSRFTCGKCDEMFEVEGDCTNGEEVTCDACATTLIVTGRM